MNAAPRHGWHDVITLALTGHESDGPAVDWAADDAAARGIPLQMICLRGPDALGAEAQTHAILTAEERANLRQPAVVITTGAQGAEVGGGGRSVVVVAGRPSSERITNELTGSVLREVGERSRCPVVIVRGVPEPTGLVVAGVDPRRDGDVLEFAFSHAARYGLDLRVVHAGAPRKRLNVFRVERALDIRSANEDIEVDRRTNALAMRYSNVRVDVREARRRPREALAREALGASLLVVGAPARRATAAQLGPFGNRSLAYVPAIAVIRGRTES